jgi:hypothetical protein
MSSLLARVNLALRLKPVPRGTLGLSKVEDLDVVRVHCVVGRAKSLIALLAVIGSVSGDPRSALRGIPVADEASLRDLGPIGLWTSAQFDAR